MGLRAYLLVEVVEEVEHEEFVDAIRELEDSPHIDFVDPVIGQYDMVVMIDAPVTVEQTASKIRELKWVKNVEIMRIVSLFERHRSSKKELLQNLPHTGLKAQ